MKKLFVALPAFFVAAVIHAQDPSMTDRSLQTEISRAAGLLPQSAIIEPTLKPNEIKGPRTTYSGIAVQLFKTDNPLQLINPFAPARYGPAEQNIVRDPLTKKSVGFKLFSIEF
jgi:hypothetical protein